MVIVAAGAWGVAIIGVGLANTLWLAVVCLALAGAADMISGLFRMIIWNQTVPDHLRGRMAGIEMLSYTAGPTLGNFEAGALASVVGVRASVVSGGVMCVVGTGVILAFLPAFWRYDARERVPGVTLPLAHETWFEAGHRDARLELRRRDERRSLLLCSARWE